MSESGAFFAGAYGGNAENLDSGAKLECKICWHVYDPELGDEAWQIPPGTPFAQLPEHWICPQCAAPKQSFLLLDE
jgi:rubredoxin